MHKGECKEAVQFPASDAFNIYGEELFPIWLYHGVPNCCPVIEGVGNNAIEQNDCEGKRMGNDEIV